jgi:hypothetical protein
MFIGFERSVVDILCQHLNQPSIIRNVGTRAVCEEGKAQSIDCQMSFNSIGRFVEAKPF